MKNREFQRQYLENCLPLSVENVNISFENNVIILNFNHVRLISSSIEEMKEKIKVALNK